MDPITMGVVGGAGLGLAWLRRRRRKRRERRAAEASGGPASGVGSTRHHAANDTAYRAYVNNNVQAQIPGTWQHRARYGK
jgi:hypothetical protein